jgi:hypothetical protein
MSEGEVRSRLAEAGWESVVFEGSSYWRSPEHRERKHRQRTSSFREHPYPPLTSFPSIARYAAEGRPDDRNGSGAMLA